MLILRALRQCTIQLIEVRQSSKCKTEFNYFFNSHHVYGDKSEIFKGLEFRSASDPDPSYLYVKLTVFESFFIGFYDQVLRGT